MPPKVERRIIDDLLSDSLQLEEIRSVVQKLKAFDVLTETQLIILFKIHSFPKIKDMVSFLEGLMLECCNSYSCDDLSEESENERIVVEIVNNFECRFNNFEGLWGVEEINLPKFSLEARKSLIDKGGQNKISYSRWNFF